MVSKKEHSGPGAVSRRRFLAGSSAAAALMLAGLPIGTRAAGTLKIGVLLPRSGHLALIGQDCQRGADLAPPLLSDLGYKGIELISADTESNPDVGRTQAEKLIREGAHVLVGTFDSGTTAAVAQVAEQKGIPFVINIAAAPQITEQGYKYTFRNFPTGPMLVKDGLVLMNTLFKATGSSPKTAVLMHVNDTFGTSMLNGIKALASKVGLVTEIKEYIAYDPKAKDLSVEVAKAKSVGADIHMAVTRLNDAILMVREMVKQRYEPMGIISPGSPGMYEGQFLKALGKYSDYAITNVPWFDPRQEMAVELGRAFTKQYPDLLFNLNTGFTFEAVLIAADAFKRAGSTNPDELAAALRTTNLDKHVMVGGPIQFNDKGQNVNIRSATLQNRDGLPRVVLPESSAEMAPVFPVPGWRDRG
ncbi:MAG: branched-chain amino acid ABC transporter [Proteobacteria bacterium]|nr:MAG: branched-chain amino acid ABC transporter [Pseudomonadota bacterium]QKK12030.1 MAG: ABC transporter substrate-binding protein [Pseudomonadota bacterium]